MGRGLGLGICDGSLSHGLVFGEGWIQAGVEEASSMLRLLWLEMTHDYE
jgi:hypothetical protein